MPLFEMKSNQMCNVHHMHLVHLYSYVVFGLEQGKPEKFLVNIDSRVFFVAQKVVKSVFAYYPLLTHSKF